MQIEHIRALAEILTAHGLTSIEVCEAENTVRLEKKAEARPVLAENATAALPTTVAPAEFPDNEPVNFNHLIEVQSPMVGVFYSAPSPDSDPFVTIGSKVKKGDVLCVIEAMKLMNEITAEQDGEIIDICVKNGDIAEFGQTLFKMY